MSSRISAIIILLFLIISRPVAYSFDLYQTLGIDDGLSKSNVTDVILDHNENLWIGTTHGLNKYAAGKFKYYYNVLDDRNSLQSNQINYIVEDHDRNIWVGTSSGLCLYDQRTDTFTRQRFDGKEQNCVSSVVACGTELYATGVGGLLNIYRYDKRSSLWIKLYENTECYTQEANLTVGGTDELLINTRYGNLYRYNLKDNICSPIAVPEKAICLKLFKASNDDLWISMYGKGIYVLREGELIHHFTSKNSGLSHDLVLDIEEADKTIWMATDGGGLCSYSLSDGKFETFRHDIKNANSLPSDALQSIFIQENGNILIGTVRDGLILMKKVEAQSYGETWRNAPYGLSNKSVLCVFPSLEGKVWLGTDGGGVNCFDTHNKTFKHYDSTRDWSVTSIIDWSDDELLIFAFNVGPRLLNKWNGTVRPFPESAWNINTYGASCLMIPYLDDKMILNSKEVYIYDRHAHTCQPIITNYHQAASPTAIDEDGNIYVVNRMKSITRYEAKSGQCIQHDFTEDINNIHYDGRKLWMATSRGISFVDPDTFQVNKLSTPLFSEALSIIMDSQNRLWIGTNSSLFVYDSQENLFYTLRETDGVQTNDFCHYAQCLLPDGGIIMGGLNGFSLISRDVHFKAKPHYDIIELDVKCNGNSILYDRKYLSHNEIRLPWQFNNFETVVKLRNGDPLSDNLFRFQVISDDRETVYEQISRSSLLLNNLQAGHYTINCSYYRNDGNWSAPQKLYQIEVMQPWYKSRWFILAVLLISIMLVASISYYILRKKEEREERKIRELKDKHNEEKISLLTNISHELRTPLTLICSILKRILKGEIPQDKIMSTIQASYSHAHHMKSIINMVLDERKFDEGLTNLYMQENDINEWLEEIVDKFRPEYEFKNILIETKYAECLPKVKFDKHKIEFVISNFLMNAVKFSEAGTKTVVATRMSDDDNYVRVLVSDEGIGLRLVNLDDIFDNFYQGAHGKGGSGIGLSYAKTLINYHEGHIGAYTNKNGGATFYFELPVRTDAKSKTAVEYDDLEKEMDLDEQEFSLLKEYTLLIAEDDSELRNYLKEILCEKFKKVYVASNGKDAYKLVKDCFPDIVVSDLMMPQMNGLELCSTIKSDVEVSHIPFVLLTAYDNKQTEQIGYKLGADVFLGKPFEIEALVSVVYNLLKMRNDLKCKMYENHQNPVAEEVCFSNADEEFLKKLNTFIIENISNPQLNVDLISSHLCMSRSLLFNKMRAIVGINLVDYITNIKISKAIEMLEKTDLTIGEIASATGFSSQAYFTKVFKKHLEKSPLKYRKSHKKS